MARSVALRVDDVAAVFELIGECRELWADAAAWQDHLVRGACRLSSIIVDERSVGCKAVELLERATRSNGATADGSQRLVETVSISLAEGETLGAVAPA